MFELFRLHLILIIDQSNILVSDEGTAVLADFGLARLVDSDSVLSNDAFTSTNTGARGTIRWMAPEIACALDSSSNSTRESDIWSFGCVILVRSLRLNPA